MGIYIKGIEMPKHRAIDLTITPDGSAIIWGTTHRLLDEKCTSIPEPHGRLVDADGLSKKLCETTIFIKDGEVFQRMIKDAPTVIEGSE